MSPSARYEHVGRWRLVGIAVFVTTHFALSALTAAASTAATSADSPELSQRAEPRSSTADVNPGLAQDSLSATPLLFGLEGMLLGGLLVLAIVALRHRADSAAPDEVTLPFDDKEGQRDDFWHYSEVIASAPLLLMEVDSELRFLFLNAVGERELGYAPGGWRGKCLSDHFHPMDRERILSLVPLRIEGKRRVPAPVRLRGSGGRWRWFESWTHPYETREGERRLLGAAWDITSEREAIDGLRISEERFRSLADYSPDLIAECDEQGRFTYASPSWETELGYSPERLLGTEIVSLGLAEEQSKLHESLHCMLSPEGEDSVRRGPRQLRSASGDLRWMDVRASTYETTNGARRVVVSLRDVTRQVDLAEAREQLANLLDRSHDLVAITDPVGRMSFLNHSGRRLVGIPDDTEIAGRPVADLVPEEYRSLLTELVLPAVMRDGEFSGTFSLAHQQTKEWIPVQLESAAIWDPAHETRVAVGLILRDLRVEQHLHMEREELTTRLDALDKLETVGLVAGGVAHDFNNLLAIVLGNISMARNQGSLSSTDDLLASAELATLRATEIVRRLLAYVGSESLEEHRFTLGEVARQNSCQSQDRPVGSATIEWDFSEAGPALLGDPLQAKQIIDHLLENAIEATEGQGGTIGVRTGSRVLSREEIEALHLPLDAVPGVFGYVEVRDSGAGIDPHVLLRAFDPFFSTRSFGRGLGLAAVMGIVRGAGGSIDLQTRPGSGTTLCVYLPAAETRTGANERGSWATVETGGTILVMEDEPKSLRLLQHTLDRGRFSVVSAKDAEEAIERYRDLEDDLVAVVLDLKLPAAEGLQVVRKIRRTTPALPVVISVRHGEEAVVRELVGEGAPFLIKPYGPDTLLSLFDEIGGRKSTPIP